MADRVTDQAKSHVVGQGEAGLQMYGKKWVDVLVEPELVDRKYVGVDARVICKAVSTREHHLAICVDLQ